LSAERPLQIPSEVKTIIGNHNIDHATKSALLLGTSQNKFKLCHFETIKKPEIKIGKKINELTELSPVLQNALNEKFPNGLYQYQEDAISKIINHKDVVISAPTGTGKTESFLIPIIQNALNNPAAKKPTALIVYPTKALAKDQYKKIRDFADKCGVRVNLVDGDVPSKDFRRYVLHNSPEIFITNFDFIKVQLQNEISEWKPFFANIQTLVIDEVHYYGGILGANVYYIIQSLQRLSEKLQIVASSATLDNSKEFCEKLGGREFEFVEEKNKPGITDFAILSELGIEDNDPSQLDIMLNLLENFHRQGKKIMVFHDSHDKAELFAWKALRERKIPIAVHRAGLLVKEREDIERQFKDNEIRCISCTPTLELGIDIGDVDVVISSTVSFSRFKQRLGRAGRNQQRSYAFLVLGKDPISQWYKNHPTDYLTQKESVLIDPLNQFVKRTMFLFLAAAKPIDVNEKLAKNFQYSIQHHLKEGNLFLRDGKCHLNYNNTKVLLKDYSIRGMGENVSVEKRGSWKTIGTRATPVAFFKFYNGAIYMHGGQHFYVTDYVPKPKYPKAVVEPLNYESYKVDPYYTRPILEIKPKILRIIKNATVKHTEATFCELLMKIKIYGYYKVSHKTNKVIGFPIKYSSPMEFEFNTAGFVLQAPEISSINKDERTDANHAAEHLLINASLTIANNSSSDLSGYTSSDGQIFLYDNSVKGGNGATEAVFRKLDSVFSRALQMVTECKCDEAQGCPLCTHLYHCEKCNHQLSKQGAIKVLESLNSDVASPKVIPTKESTTSHSNDWMSGSSYPENSVLDESVLKPQHKENNSEYDADKELEKTIKYRGYARYGGYGNSIDKSSSYTWSDD